VLEAFGLRRPPVYLLRRADGVLHLVDGARHDDPEEEPDKGEQHDVMERQSDRAGGDRAV
jgi:hypothetical protein